MAIAAVTFVAALFRWLYVAGMGLPSYDPWRHLLLVQNLREGLGFTLFEDQPYLWYSPLWYWFCAALPSGLAPEWPAAALSVLCVPVCFLLLERMGGPERLIRASVGALLLAASGPVVKFTCHYGSEAPALLLTLAGLLVAYSWSNRVAALCGGLLFGLALVLRLNFAFNIVLFLPALGRKPASGPGSLARKRLPDGTLLMAGTGLPLVLTWLRNRAIIADYDYLFTWDGLATRTADFNLLSTLVIQMHPAVEGALRRLHEQVVPWPQWILGSTGIHWSLIAFMLGGIAALVASRRWELMLGGGVTLGYFLLFDSTHSSNFFRIYLALFPAFFIGAAYTAIVPRVRWPTWVGWIPAALLLIGGASMLSPRQEGSLEIVTPPPELLREDRYMVNSSFYHPESLMYRFPQKRFIGMPLEPEQFEDFRAHYPAYRHVLWHDFSVQDGIADRLDRSPDCRPIRASRNNSGRLYTVWQVGSDLPAP